MTKVYELDDVLQGVDSQQEEFGQKFIKKDKSVKKSKITSIKDDFNLKTTSGALLAHSEAKLKHYLKSSPQFKIVESQLVILKTELLKYKKLGNTIMFDKTKTLIIEMSSKKQDLVKIFKNKKEGDNEKIKISLEKSPELAMLKKEQKELENEFKMKNPNSIMKDFEAYRKIVDLNIEDDEIIDIDDIFSEEFDEEIEKGVINKKYDELVLHIANIINEPIETVMNMSNKEVLDNLKTNTPDLSELKKSLDIKKMEISSQIKKIKGSNDITDVMFEIFDFNYDEKQPKEMLAASNIKYVNAIAYNMCSNLNMLHNFDDAVSYGLLGLSIAIDKWYKLQKLSDSALSFEGFIYQYVSKSISRGLYELTSSGRISKSVMATLVHKRNKFMKMWIQNNPEFADLPTDMLESLLPQFDETLSLPENTVTESELTATITGGEDSGDVWANTIADNTEFNLGEAKIEYEKFLLGLKNLFLLFETKINKETGVKELTKKKIFDIYDYMLFKMYFGLDFKHGATDGKSYYDQKEMGKKLMEYNKTMGITKTFSQPAVNARINTMLNKIKTLIDESPSIRAGFEFLYTYRYSDALNILSNQREEFEMNVIDDIPENFKNTPNELEHMMSNGKRLTEIFETSDENVLDEEIADLFMN